MPRRHDCRGSNLRAAPWMLLPLLIACSAPPPPAIQVPQPAAESAKSGPGKPHSPIPVAPETSSTAPPTPQTTVVVDSGVEGNGLGEADIVSLAQAEKERRAKGSRSSIVITNETLVKRPGQKPGLAGAKKEASIQPVAPSAHGSSTDLAREAQEALWKARALDIRIRLKAANDEVEKLRKLTASMRERFYLSPPQFGRDDSLWQEWGRLQASLTEAERAFEATQKELEMFLEDGRMAGAEPGWLAAGEEILIQKKEEQSTPPAQAIEPPVVPPSGDRP